MEVDPTILAIYRSLDLIGVLLNGAIGGTIARQRRFDIVGFSILAVSAALGGGMIRDTLLQRGTPAAIQEPIYLGMAIVGGLIAWVTNLDGRWWDLFKVHGDSIVLGVWAVTGSMKAMTLNVHPVPAVLMGVITAIGGGMVRDVLTGSIPVVFGGNTLYAVPAFLSACVMVVAYLEGQVALGMIVAAVLGSGIAIAAYWRGWSLNNDPQWAPVNMTTAQLRRALRRAEKRGEAAGKAQGFEEGYEEGFGEGVEAAK
ncbi:trimeric intracellular cation channel family protein [Staphylococcus chromogenes]|nr:trimeric intracellular cation channel family protein [Staphylococcus chromogenes]